MAMTAAGVKVAFNDCTSATDTVMVSVPGGWFALTADAGFATDVAAASSLSLTQAGLRLSVFEGATLSGSPWVAVAWSDGDVPALLLENVAGPPTAQVTWPTGDGPVTQLLTPGEPMALADIIADR